MNPAPYNDNDSTVQRLTDEQRTVLIEECVDTPATVVGNRADEDLQSPDDYLIKTAEAEGMGILITSNQRRNMNADEYEPKIVKQILFEVVLLDWGLIEDSFRKKWLKKRKKPVVLSPAQVDAQVRLKQVSRRLSRLWKKLSALNQENHELRGTLKGLADDAIDQHRDLPPRRVSMAARARLCGQCAPPGADELPDEDQLQPPVEPVAEGW
jgi:hypothetical protein